MRLPIFVAFLMVALNRKISFGRNDWALLVCSLGILPFLEPYLPR